MVIFNSTDRCQIINKIVSTDRIERHSGSSWVHFLNFFFLRTRLREIGNYAKILLQGQWKTRTTVSRKGVLEAEDGAWHLL